MIWSDWGAYCGSLCSNEICVREIGGSNWAGVKQDLYCEVQGTLGIEEKHNHVRFMIN